MFFTQSSFFGLDGESVFAGRGIPSHLRLESSWNILPGLLPKTVISHEAFSVVFCKPISHPGQYDQCHSISFNTDDIVCIFFASSASGDGGAGLQDEGRALLRAIGREDSSRVARMEMAGQ